MFDVDPKKAYLKEFSNITIFPNRETGRFVATKLHANSSYEVYGDSQEDSSTQATTGSNQGPSAPYGSYTSYQFTQGQSSKRPPPSAYSSKGRKVTRKTIGLETLKSTKGKLISETVTEVIVCLADNDQCIVPVVAQPVKEQVGYNIILLNNKLYPILDATSTRGDFWRSSSRKILAASAKLYEKITGKRPKANGLEIDLTGNEDIGSPPASPSAAKKQTFEEEVKMTSSSIYNILKNNQCFKMKLSVLLNVSYVSKQSDNLLWQGAAKVWLDAWYAWKHGYHTVQFVHCARVAASSPPKWS